MSKIMFNVGGQASGKTRKSQEVANEWGGSVLTAVEPITQPFSILALLSRNPATIIVEEFRVEEMSYPVFKLIMSRPEKMLSMRNGKPDQEVPTPNFIFNLQQGSIAEVAAALDRIENKPPLVSILY